MVIGGGSEGPSRQSCCFSLKSLRLARHKRSNSSSLKEGCGRNYSSSSSSYFSDSNFYDCHAVFFSSRLAATRLDTTTTNTNWRPLWPVAVASITSSLGTARKSCRPQPPPTRSSGKKTTSLWWPTRRRRSRLYRRRRPRPHRCLCSRDRRSKREELESYRYLCLLEATASGRRQQNKQPPKRSLPPPPAPAKAATRSLSDDDNSSLRSWLEGLQQPLPFAA